MNLSQIKSGAIRGVVPLSMVALLMPIVGCGGVTSAPGSEVVVGSEVESTATSAASAPTAPVAAASNAASASGPTVVLVGPPTPSLLLDTSTTGLTGSGAYGWITAPADFLRGQQLDMVGAPGSSYSFNRPFPFPLLVGNPVIDWTRPAITSDQLSGGVKLSTAQVIKTGSSSLRWNQHSQYPTLMSELVGQPDWSNYGGIYVSVYSAQATGEVITLGVRSDNPATRYLDYWTSEITIDWTGWKELILPFSSFSTIGQPRDWTSVSGIYFFSKTKRRTPSPTTDLSFGQLALVPTAAATPTAPSQALSPTGGLQLTFDYGLPPNYVNRNHSQPEVSNNLIPGTGQAEGTRVSQLPFFAATRSQYNYNPRYNPGYVSVDPKGHAYIRAQADTGLSIQWLDANNKWQVTDLAETIKTWILKENNNGKPWSSTSVTETGTDPTIRFDRDGDAYVLVNYLNDGAGGVAGMLLLHTKDITHPNWKVYKLTKPGPNYFRGITADFEKIDTFNQDAINRPPVIMLSTSTYAKGTNQAAYLLLPSKNADGTLALPEPVEYTPYGAIGPVHSGGANFAISKGDNIYLVYGYLAPPTGANGAVNPSDATYLAKMPLIPTNHFAKSLTWTSNSVVNKAVDGVPVFVRAYNRITKVLSTPVFLGYGGGGMDGHNWPAMTIDATGHLHVILNGHNNPLGYTRTLQPDDISQWTDEAYVTLSEPNKAGVKALVTYGGINIDQNNQLVVTVRSDTQLYNHRLAMFTKPAVPNPSVSPLGSEKWSAERSMVVPFSDNYHVWSQRVTYDPTHHRLYFAYWDQGGQTALSRDGYLFNRFIWPESELAMTGGAAGSGLNEGLPTEGKMSLFNTMTADFTLLVSENGGATWRIATTPDFVAN